MLEQGDYYGRLLCAGLDKSQGGTPFMFLEFLLTYQSVGGEWKPITSDIKREVRIYLSDKSRNSGIPQQQLKSLGFNGDFSHPKFDPAVHNDGIQLRCTHDRYTNNQGVEKDHEKWELANWGGARERAEVDADTVRLMNHWWKNEAQPAAPAGAPPKPPAAASAPTPSPAATATDDSEPPF